MNLYDKIRRLGDEAKLAPTSPKLIQNLTDDESKNTLFPNNKDTRMFGVRLHNQNNIYLMVLKAKTGINRDAILQALIEEMQADKEFENKIIYSALKILEKQNKKRKRNS